LEREVSVVSLPKARIQSWTTLIGASLLLAAHALIVGAILDEGTAYTKFTALLAVPFTISALTALIASFSGSAQLRASSSIAALVSAVPPATVLLFYFGAGLFYLPGITILLIGVCTNTIIRRAPGVLIALATGFTSGLMFLLSYWPLVAAYDACDRLHRGGTWECLPAISSQGVAIALAIIGAAVLLLWFTTYIARQPRSGAPNGSTSIPPRVSA
jgi:hypothetical protein